LAVPLCVSDVAIMRTTSSVLGRSWSLPDIRPGGDPYSEILTYATPVMAALWPCRPRTGGPSPSLDLRENDLDRPGDSPRAYPLADPMPGRRSRLPARRGSISSRSQACEYPDHFGWRTENYRLRSGETCGVDASHGR